jgi:tryptophanyl-tRNA synthetase
MKENEENSKEVRVLTGDRPTGRLHLGHFVGSIQNRLKLQDKYTMVYYMVADVQALTDNADNPDKVMNNVREVIIDNLACGVDPKKTTFFVQSMIPQIAELTIFFLNLVTVSRLKRNPTVKNEMKQKGYGDAVPAGFLMYPVSQAADILFLRSNLIPVGEDQLPMIEQTNEIADSFNRYYGKVFDYVKAILGEHGRLPGIDGNAKMSKSLGNGIYLSDDRKTIEKKVMQMYTDPNHIHVNDPGEVKGNMVFTYLDIFDSNKGEVEELKMQYKKGGLGDVQIKKRLIDVLDTLLEPIRERRKYFENNPGIVDEIIKSGVEKVRGEAEEYMIDVRKHMKINYFT